MTDWTRDDWIQWFGDVCVVDNRRPPLTQAQFADVADRIDGYGFEGLFEFVFFLVWQLCSSLIFF